MAWTSCSAGALSTPLQTIFFFCQELETLWPSHNLIIICGHISFFLGGTNNFASGLCTIGTISTQSHVPGALVDKARACWASGLLVCDCARPRPRLHILPHGRLSSRARVANATHRGGLAAAVYRGGSWHSLSFRSNIQTANEKTAGRSFSVCQIYARSLKFLSSSNTESSSSSSKQQQNYHQTRNTQPRVAR